MSVGWQDLLGPYFMEEWHAQSDRGMTPTAVRDGLRQALGRPEVEFVHPVDGEDGEISFLMYEGGRFLLARVAPTETTISYLGSLTGGVYEQIAVKTREGWVQKGCYSHERLRQPLRFTFRPSPEGFHDADDGAPRRYVNSNVLREKLQELSSSY